MHDPTYPLTDAVGGVYVCTMDSESFAFVAVGRTSDEALDAMVATMRRHQRGFPNGDTPWMPEDLTPEAYGAPEPDPDSPRWLRYVATEYYGANIAGPLALGRAGARDGEAIS
jgi:hypothetical protein